MSRCKNMEADWSNADWRRRKKTNNQNKHGIYAMHSIKTILNGLIDRLSTIDFNAFKLWANLSIISWHIQRPKTDRVGSRLDISHH